jgi:hypothetical protein
VYSPLTSSLSPPSVVLFYFVSDSLSFFLFFISRPGLPHRFLFHSSLHTVSIRLGLQSKIALPVVAAAAADLLQRRWPLF